MTEHLPDVHRTNGGAGRWVFWALILIIGVFLAIEHREHVIKNLPFLLILACPLMHFFHRHGRHDRHSREGADRHGGKEVSQ